MGSIRLYGSTSGYLELQAPAVAPDAVLTLPSDSVQPGLVHLHTESFSAVSSVSVDNVFTNTYDTYRAMIAITGLSTDLGLFIKLRASGSDDSTGNYYFQYLSGNQTTVSAGNVASQTYWDMGSIDGATSDFRYVASMDMYGPQAATRTFVIGNRGRYASDGTPFVQSTSNWHLATTSFDGLSLIASTGTMTGTLRVYGYRNS